jgi:hypothetical protein
LPATEIFPGDQVFALCTTPTDVAPLNVIGVPLVIKLVLVPRRIVKGTAWVVHPSRRGQEMTLWPPAVEEGEPWRSTNLVCRDGLTGLLVLTGKQPARVEGRATGKSCQQSCSGRDGPHVGYGLNEGRWDKERTARTGDTN